MTETKTQSPVTKLKLTRSIVWLDIESTGTDPVSDSIVSLSMCKVNPDGRRYSFYRIFNPMMEIAPEVIAVHGITNEEAARHKPFGASAIEVNAFVAGCDLGGFNITGFDVQILWEELYRNKIELDLAGVSIVDSGNLFKIREPRDLTAAVKFYTGRERKLSEGRQHNAELDVEETMAVFEGQRARYPDMEKMTVEELGIASIMERDGSRRLDLAGTVIIDKEGVARFTHKRVRGKRVEDDLGYLDWMLRSDFSQQTKRVLTKLRDEIYANMEQDQEKLF